MTCSKCNTFFGMSTELPPHHCWAVALEKLQAIQPGIPPLILDVSKPVAPTGGPTT
jgi:hypothetical protein